MTEQAPREGVRLDKWLWAARFFKTRSLASEAVKGGHVHVNGARAKPARTLQAGDRLRVSKGTVVWTVVVEHLSDRRGPASVAEQLYRETADSRSAREARAEERRTARAGAPRPERRPDKKSRRQIRRFTGRE
ncbi:MAG: S4 domain-containing protein [Gammaproteobacteria bacterium]|jgi:ribosome-associated heat shock protein Hsp15